MRAYKCDCCGSLYESYKTVVLGEQSLQHEQVSANCVTLYYQTSMEKRPIKDYDLCPTCMFKLIHLLEKNREDVNNK